MRSILIILMFLFISCQNDFNQELWLKNNQSTKNKTRLKMSTDLMNNFLKKGMTKSAVINLLGNDFSTSVWGIDSNNSFKIPDSLKIKMKYESVEDERLVLTQYHRWFVDKCDKCGLLLTYQLDSSYSSMTVLEIKFDKTYNLVGFGKKEISF